MSKASEDFGLATIPQIASVQVREILGVVLIRDPFSDSLYFILEMIRSLESRTVEIDSCISYTLLSYTSFKRFRSTIPHLRTQLPASPAGTYSGGFLVFCFLYLLDF